jgi:ribonuclease P protein component
MASSVVCRPARVGLSFAHDVPAADAASRSEASLGRERMPRQESLRGERAYNAVFRAGRRAAGERLTVRVLRNGMETNRYGFIAPRRVGSAVARNRIRRRLRHALLELSPQAGWDVAIVAHPAARTASYAVLRDDLGRLLLETGVQVGASQ